MTISSYLQGGLGNQMFQYAIARSLSEHYQIDFTLDSSWFNSLEKGVTPRKLELPLLQIDEALFKENGQLSKGKKLKLAFQHYLPFGPIIERQVDAYDFNDELFNLKRLDVRDLHLFGYWQSFKYFNQIRPLLQQDFLARSALPETHQKYLAEIKSSESVMMHIRRGDYVHSPSASKFHGALDIEYYLSAMKHILSIYKNAHFFIFSDDLVWAKASLPSDIKFTYINSAIKDSAIHELQLMTYCKHHIIANSSFSWWGAWLKKDFGGNIYSPNRWISDRNLDLSNLLPADWIRLPA
jgi:hypothetical protein